MGLGDGAFGFEVFGTDPPTFSGEYQRVAPPEAVWFDPLTRDFLLDSAGRYRELSNIEQQVLLSFAIPRGYLKHAPLVGHDFMTLPRLGTAALDAEIDRRAKLATPFDRLLTAGTVELVGAIEKRHPKDTETRMLIQWRIVGETTVRTTTVGFS